MKRLARAALLASCFISLSAAAVTKSYDVSHGFTLRPGGTIVPNVFALTFEHAWVHDLSLRSDVNPLGQPAGFSPEGREFIYPGDGSTHQGGLKLNELSMPVAAAGGTVSETARVNAPINSAFGTSVVTIAPFSAGSVVSGTIRAFGEATANGPHDAYAFSSGRFAAQGGTLLKSGQIKWLPGVVSPTVAGAAYAIWDPISFQLSDVTGTPLRSGTLLEILANGNGSLSWIDGLFSLDASDATFSIDISSPFTTQKGSLVLQVSGGLITHEQQTGMFSSLVLPALGSSGTFTMSLANEVTLDYDLDPLGTGPLNVELNFAGGGSVIVAIPEPDTYALITTGLCLIGWVSRRRIHNAVQ